MASLQVFLQFLLQLTRSEFIHTTPDDNDFGEVKACHVTAYGNTESWEADNPFCDNQDESPINIDLDGDIKGSDNCPQDGFEWKLKIPNHPRYKATNNGHSVSLTAISDDGTPLNLPGNTIASFENYFAHPTDIVERVDSFCLDSFHFHWGSLDYKGSEHRINGRQYPLEAHFVHYNCAREGGIAEVNELYHNETLVENAKNDGYDYHELGVVGIFFEVSEEDNPAFDALFSVLDEIEKPRATVEDDGTCNQLGYNLKDNLDLNDLIPFDAGLDENGFFSYEGSLTTPPCTTDARWYLMKTLGCISERQLEKFRSLMGVFENGTTYNLYDNNRPVQYHNYTAKPIYECGEARQEPMLGECEDDDDDDLEQMFETWYIIGIVFIVLFGVSLVIIGFLLWKADCCSVKGQPSRRGGYQTTSDHDQEHDSMEMAPNDR